MEKEIKETKKEKKKLFKKVKLGSIIDWIANIILVSSKFIFKLIFKLIKFILINIIRVIIGGACGVFYIYDKTLTIISESIDKHTKSEISSYDYIRMTVFYILVTLVVLTVGGVL